MDPVSRTLALDWGKARIGLAVTDETNTFVRTLPTLRRKNRSTDLAALSQVIEEGVDEVSVHSTEPSSSR